MEIVRRIWFGALLVIVVVAVLLTDAIPQDPGYHSFADVRTCLGTENCANVWSNLVFLLIGAYGLATLRDAERRGIYSGFRDAAAYYTFFLAVAAVSAGSAYYHLAPDNNRLFWDRLPITVAFMALFTCFLQDRIPRFANVRWVLPVLVLFGFASLLYWIWTEQMSQGDIRLYVVVQFLPMLAIPLLCLLYPRGRYTDGRYIMPVVGSYGLAKLFEHFDVETFHFLGGMVSGHTLKHMAAALAVYFVAAMVRNAGRPVSY